MYTTIICQKKDKRNCILIAQYGDEKLKLYFQITFWKTEKKIWIFVHKIKREFQKKGFQVTGSQISSALCAVYADIPYVYY